ncbi:MAG: hypothetical protein PHO26_11125 [Dehalococcoidia bacterium]|nr:hypothetical protein [Dehalococcoidia bacterium]MDD5494231.1 hypothetical protein [Dehalococcoidia bacterium]
MADKKKSDPTASRYLPTMTQDYSRISDTARAVESIVLPKIISYIRGIAPRIAHMHSEKPFMMADYGADDGVNSSELFEKIITQIRAVNPSLKIKLLYVDIADRAGFDKFWETSRLAQMEGVDAEYIRRSFYEPFPEIAGKLDIGFSSTSLHWLDTKTVKAGFFQHPFCIQANQLAGKERRKFVEKWRGDWRVFFRECSVELVDGGALFLANLTDLGHDCWPASAGYNNIRNVCSELYQEGRISKEELNAIFVPDYFATPQEMKSLLNENDIKQALSLKSSEEMTVPCAYFTKWQDKLDDAQERSLLAATLAHVVRAWSSSSVGIGLAPGNKGQIEEIYSRLKDKFYETPVGLPYQYCLLELVKRGKSTE